MTNKLKYDSRKNEIDLFLKDLYEMNKDIKITPGTIYSYMKNFSLKIDDMNSGGYSGDNVEDLFEHWFTRFNSNPQSRKRESIFSRKINNKNTYACRGPGEFRNFFLFMSKESIEDDKYIKFYIPIDKEHLEDGVNLLFEFLDREKIKHTSKVANKIRSDNVIVRIAKDDIESRDKIINFLNKNKYIQKGLNRINPLVPSINGIGIMNEHGNSYNGDIAYYVLEYIKEASANHEDVSAQKFREFLIYCSQNAIRFDDEKYFDYELLQTFDTAYFGEEQEYSDYQKRSMFIDAIKNMFNNHGLNETINAIKEIIAYNNYNLIQNDESKVDLKGNLEYFVDRIEVVKYINDYLYSMDFPTQTDIDTKITYYCQNVFRNQIVFEFDEICSATLLKYGSEQLKGALSYYIRENNTDRFTRFYKNKAVNYRDRLEQFDHSMALDIINSSLINKGVFLNNPNVDDYIDNYVIALSRSLYTDLSNKPSSIKTI